MSGGKRLPKTKETNYEKLYVAFAALWTQEYGYSVGIAGLHYIALGIGFTVSPLTHLSLSRPCTHSAAISRRGLG